MNILYISIFSVVAVSTSLLLGIMYFRRRAARIDDALLGSLHTGQESAGTSIPTATTSKTTAPRPCNLKPIRISTTTLKKLIPIRHIKDEILSMIQQTSEPAGAGTRLFRAEEKVDSVVYLLQGTVGLETEDGREYEIQAGTTKSRFPLSIGKKHSITGYAKTDVQLLRVPENIINLGVNTNSNTNSSVKMSIKYHQLDIPAELQLSGLVHSFFQALEKNDVRLPSLPDISIKLSRAIKDEVSIAEAAKIVQLDPTIVAKIIQVANSPLFLTSNSVKRCQDAIITLGLVATKNLVTSISLHNVFKSNQPHIKQHLRNLWKHSVTLSSICFILAQKTKYIDPEKALLAGLLSDIGVVPFLNFAENFPRELFDREELDAAIPYIRGPAGTMILKKWDFPDELAEIPSLAEDWYHNSSEELTLSDIVVLAKLHSYIGTPQMSELPFVNTIPAFAKLGKVGLSPELSLDLLHDAQEQINAVKNFL